MIKKFKITNLFGYKTVDLNFNEKIKILIGENGSGKTTVLNALYYVLSQKYSKLNQIIFEEIEIQFKNRKKFKISKIELDQYIDAQENKRKYFPLHILEQALYDVKNTLDEMVKSQKKHDVDKYLIDYIQKMKFPKVAPLQIMSRELFNYYLEQISFSKFNELNKFLSDQNMSILYFPTYRRVEEDLKNLGKLQAITKSEKDYYRERYRDEKEELDINDETLIHFGMEDVENRIKKIQEEINRLSVSGFSRLTGEMLSQILKGFPEVDKKKLEKLDENTVKIILERVRDNLSKADRNTILNLICDKEELRQKKDLVYLISKLINIYEEQKHLDDAVKKFVEVCNKYLKGKAFIYDESTVNIQIYRKNSKDHIVALNKLSSGEKQIISLFSKIYLENYSKMIVLFDEPELSLSLEWQKQLLPDIVSSNKCEFLLSVTHSPFIFKNDLAQYAIGMSVYVEENGDVE